MRVPDCAAGQARVGVAIQIPEPWAGRLRAARASFGDPHAASVPPHVTLVPPTAVAKDQVGAVADHLAASCAGLAPFRLRLRGTGTFRPVSPVVFIQVAEGISNCEQLEKLARSGPLAQRLEFPYHPHVTVAHEVCEADLDRAFSALAGFEAVFTVDAFELYCEDHAGVWRPVERIALAARASESSR
ncbi:MAG: 2'-5' RNA ligase family protein [Bifidobacteriaceae bacterium]|jgi:2'-5' RNA ligase|nr:2'-5' RNA ligase family protein [Bifidobacteriaceae bacterium]